ncbi:hypothetical protein NX81_001590 [Xanthomonas vasicola]|uniref:hypothetical protein n=1 Tax=Xanthomonas vasicola TaxID=56459 RepID=UPI000F85359C|nr:hypothetical protein [Xanthomonas vasicola]AZR21284.1 hypothetical protein NX81_001590 [Xanthomonas vasicola]
MINRYGCLERNHMVSRAAIAAGLLLALTIGSAMPSIAQDKDARFQLASVDQQTKSAISRSLKVELQKYIDGQMGRLPDQDAHILVRDGLINATGKRSNRIRRAEGAQIADFLPVSAVCGVLPGLQAQLPRSRH